MRLAAAFALLASAAAVEDVVLAHFSFDADAFVNHVDTPILGFDRVAVDETGHWHRWDITIHGWCKIEEYKGNMAWHVVYGNEKKDGSHCKITTKSPIHIPFFYDQCKFSLQVTDLDYKYYAKNNEEWWSVNDAKKEMDDFMCFSIINSEDKVISTAKQCQFGDIGRRRRLIDYEYERPVTTGEHAELNPEYGAAFADKVYYMQFHEFGSVEKTHVIESPYIGIDELKGGIKVLIEAGTDHASEHWYADDMKIQCTPRAPVDCKNNEYYYGRVADEGFCSHCPAGRYSDGCTDCEKNAEGFGPTMCEIRGLTCAKGSFAVAKDEGDVEGHSCRSCPKGYMNNVVHSDECLGCSAGTYSGAEGQTECSQCEVGRFAETDLAHACTSCTTTAYACLAGSKSVTPLGSKFSSECRCETCGVGTFSLTPKSEVCTSCEKGSFQDSEGAVGCKTCQRGWYAGVVGAVGCTKCPEGTHTDAEGSNSLDKCIAKDCPPGQYEFIVPGGDSHCTDCAAGRYGGKDERSISRCISCPEVTIAGKLVGTYAHGAGMAACKPCPQAGDSATSHDTVPNAEKTSCTANWCHAGRYKYFHPSTKMNYCLPCPAGKYGSVEHPSVGGVCHECDSGKFQFASAKKTCESCPTDYWTSEAKGATECSRAPTVAPTTSPTASPTKTPTAPPTAYPTPPTPAPTPVHFMPGLAATVTLTNVTVQEFPAHQHTFELVIAEALGCKKGGTDKDAVCTWTDAHVDEVKTTTNTDCDRVLFSGIAAGHEQADRMGYYYKTHDTYEGRPVYQQTYSNGESNFLYWTHKGWVVGPKAGGRIAGLISPDVGADGAEEISKEWYTFITNAEWLDGEWIPAPALKMECKPAPKITVWFNVHNKDCSAAGTSKMDLFPQRLKDLMALPYRAEGNLVREFKKGGLLATHLQPVYSTIVSCAPIIKLSLHRHYVQHSSEAPVKTSCHFDGSDIHVDKNLEKSNEAVAIKGTTQTAMLLNAVPGALVASKKYRVTLDGTGQVEDIDGKYLVKIGTMAKNCENRFVPEKGVWRCECYHYDSDENIQTRTHATLPPSTFPTSSPTGRPTAYPTFVPTKSPTGTPTKVPTNPPTTSPTATPTKVQEGWAYKEWWHMDTAN